MMEIPSYFRLVNRDWTVLYESEARIRELSEEDEETHGLCDPVKAVIYLARELDQYPLAYKRHCFWHEFVHAIKFANGEDNHDEEVVDRVAGMIQQAVESFN
mgnify:CR=1 FL=1